MRIVCTGISGVERTEYLERLVKFAEKKGKKIKLYSVGRMLFEHAQTANVPLTKENVLNTAPATIKALRSAVFEKIMADIGNHEHAIISTHADFYWKKTFTRAYDWDYLSKINADMYIVMIDNVSKILDYVTTDSQWKPQNLTADELLMWQNVEVNTTKGWAELFEKPSFAIARAQPIETLYKLMFYPGMKPVYASFPMTHLSNPKHKKRIIDFVNELNKYFVVFNPATIELGPAAGLADSNQTVMRDLWWYIEQSQIVAAIFPEVVLSTGVINELREGYEANKEVYLIFPNKTQSPFTNYYTHKVFASEKEFFTFIEKEKGIKKIKI